MTNAEDSTAAYWINHEKAQNPNLKLDADYDENMKVLARLAMEQNPGMSEMEAMIRATLIMMTRGDAGLSRYKIDSITTRLMHSLKEYMSVTYSFLP